MKDKYCYSAVNEMWTATAPTGEREPWAKLARNMGWGVEPLNDAFGEWALHNITWDYQDPPPTAGGSPRRSTAEAPADAKGFFGGSTAPGSLPSSAQRRRRLGSAFFRRLGG